MPYADETALIVGASAATAWTYPWQVGIPLIDDVINTLFPRPTTDVISPWTIPIRDRWEEFVGWVKGWFAEHIGETIDDAEMFGEWLLEACEYAADQMGFDLWDSQDGLPSMPAYSPVSGGG